VQRVARALAGLLALHLGGEGGQREHDLVDGAVERALAVLEVEPDADARLDELLQRVGRLDLLAAEPGLLGHDQDLERRPRLQRAHQADEARALDELGAIFAEPRERKAAEVFRQVASYALNSAGDTSDPRQNLPQ
jgi:hypothetical protein